MRRKRDFIPDELSPDFSTCENCGEAIGWDDYSYTHMSNGFSTCGTIVSGGEKPKGFLARVMKSVGVTGVVNPKIVQEPYWFGKNAEPVEWYEEVA